MKPHLDKSADALYIRLDDSAIVESEEISPGVVVDYNESNDVVGIEVLRLSKRVTNRSTSARALSARNRRVTLPQESQDAGVARPSLDRRKRIGV